MADDPPQGMNHFLIIWFARTISTIGSRMTGFALTLYVFEETGQATAIAAFSIAFMLPSLIISLFSGVIADRFNRKWLIIIGDTGAGLSTVVMLALFVTGQLETWHLYIAYAINAPFTITQLIAYQASVTLLVEKSHYTRASALAHVTHYSSNIISPALATPLYVVGGLGAVFVADIITFTIAIVLTMTQVIPQPARIIQQKVTILRDLSSGLSYLWRRPSLLALETMIFCFIFFNMSADGVWSPLILARTGNNEAALTLTIAASGIGGLLTALIVSTRGIPTRWSRPFMVGAGMAIFGVLKTGFGLSQTELMWVVFAFLASSISAPWVAAYRAIVMAKVEPATQGRIFGTTSMLQQLGILLATIISPVVSDFILEPGMVEGGSLAVIFGGVLGVGTGTGYSLMFTLSGLGMVTIGLIVLSWRPVREIETTLPDHDSIDLKLQLTSV